MYFLRRSWERGSTKHPVPSLPLFDLHGDMGGVVLPVAVDHILGQHLILQKQLVRWGRGGEGGGRPIKKKRSCRLFIWGVHQLEYTAV